jgi:MFS family permease
VLDRYADRTVMVRAALVLAVALLAAVPVLASAGSWRWPALLALWAAVGAGSALVLTPAARVLRRSADAGDRPALFAADFALSHACWLVCYPLAGWVGATAGVPAAVLVLAGITAVAGVVATRLWPVHDPEVVEHEHHDLDPDHEHLVAAGGRRHAHPFRIDDVHVRWPAKG